VKPTFFRNAAAFRAWLRVHHKTAAEITLQLVKNHAAETGMTYTQALDEALCFGWIDGVRRRYDTDSFTQRFTPRRKGSRWSRINVTHARRLIAAKRMTRAGLAEFEKRDEARGYPYGREDAVLRPEEEARFRRNRAAWADYCGRRPSYQRACLHWITSAKRTDTRARRMDVLIECSAKGQPIPPMKFFV
jgi:uncharacterized protein YdeI (YjbR/CyaY-like superfamily)